jgi:isopentenyl diphosphate isomerase/L-lactate dehydrogenase-like FMN-dependent dehydrogenase
MSVPNTIEEYREAARRRLPSIVFDYVDGGAGSRAAVAGNRRAFDEVVLRPRGGTDPATIDASVTVLGHTLPMPVLLAPTGMSRIVHPSGDLAGVRAAKRAGTVFIQSAMSGHRVADVVHEAAGSPVWFQLYRIGSQADAEKMLAQARDAGIEALVVTMDSTMPPPGLLRRPLGARGGPSALLGRNRLRAAPAFVRLMRHPRWLGEHLGAGIRPKLMNVVDEHGESPYLGRGPGPTGIGWHDLAWIRKSFHGPIFVKGIIVPEDAVRAVEEGAAGVMVSNHGGRQLDYADATLQALPEMVDAVNGRCDVFVDGGVRSGIDVLKAVSLGAKAVLIGRPWLWGLAVGGQAGVEDVLELLRDELLRSLARLGSGKVSELDRSYVRVPAGWLGAPRASVDLPLP